MKHALLTMIGLALTLPAWSQQIPPVVISDANAAPQIEIPEGAFEITVPNLGTIPADASGRDAVERRPSSVEALELDDAVSAGIGVEALDDMELVITRDGIRDAAHGSADGGEYAAAIATRPRGGRIIVIARSGNRTSVAIAPSATVTVHAACSSATSRRAVVAVAPRVSIIERAPDADPAQAEMPAPQISEYSRPEPPLPSSAELLEASNAGYSLTSAAPNPVSTTTSISFTLPRAGHALLAVYDNAGRVVATLADESLDAGTHTRTFDAAGLPAGLYLYRLSSGSFAETKTMTVVR